MGSQPHAPQAASVDKSTAKTPRVTSVAVRAPRKDSRNQGNAILQLSLDSKPDFRAMVFHKAGKKLIAKDDGVYPDLKAGDGVFAVFDNVKEAPKTTSRGSFSTQTGRSENENGFTRSPDRTRKKYRPAGSVVGTPT